MKKSELEAEVTRLTDLVTELEAATTMLTNRVDYWRNNAESCGAERDAMSQLVPSSNLPLGQIQVVDPELLYIHKHADWRLDIYIDSFEAETPKLLTRIPIDLGEYGEQVEPEVFSQVAELRNVLAKLLDESSQHLYRIEVTNKACYLGMM